MGLTSGGREGFRMPVPRDLPGLPPVLAQGLGGGWRGGGKLVKSPKLIGIAEQD